ncbi:hypothetical protein MMC06_006341 [Schaereria dolodes]|nr:hypothetical protein [Schaereria dolodes]
MEDGVASSGGDTISSSDKNDEEERERDMPETNTVTPLPGNHKRSFSGSLLSKLSFLRSSQDLDELSMAFPDLDGSMDETENSQSRNPPTGVMASVLQNQKKTRKRKGSLRKTALLGPGRVRLEGKEKRGSGLEQVQTLKASGNDAASTYPLPSPSFSTPVENLPTPRGIAPPIPLSTKPNILGNNARRDDIQPISGLVRSPTFGDTSTTDDDDMITFSRSPASGLIAPILKKPLSSGSDSYFPAQIPGLQRRRSTNKPHSPLETTPIESVAVSEDWDYSNTEWWGWVVLVVTWVVFVVGMGSCFEVWSWAWDVGETPKAPPELEDDPTLPIVGYYPALIILTAVMAWVWVVVAWVGMKYFKHAKISGEDA